MQDNNQQPNLNPQPVQPTGNLVNRGKVLQPVSDMSEYVNQAPVKPVQAHQTTPSPAPTLPRDTSKIYPDAVQNRPPINAPIPSQKVAADNNTRVAARVPSLQVYAFLIIIYGLFTVIASSSIFQTTRTLQSTGGRITTAGTYSLSPVLILVFGIAAINIAIGIYLLMAKNIKTVNGLLTALLIIGGLGLLNTLVATAQVISHINSSTVISIVISAGLLMYLWNVKSAVDLAST